MNSNIPIVSVTNFVRDFSSYVDLLPKVEEIILTRDSQPVATIKASPEAKNANIKKFFGVWKGTSLDNDKLWKKILSRRNRKKRYSW